MAYISPEKSQRARDAAMAAHKERGAAMKALREGTIDPIDAILGNVPEHDRGLGVARLFTLLPMIPGITSLLAEEIIEQAGVRPTSRLRDVGYATRKRIAEIVLGFLEERGKVYPVAPDPIRLPPKPKPAVEAPAAEPSAAPPVDGDSWLT